MSLNEKRFDKSAVLSILILAVLLAYLIAFGIINFAGFAKFCTTDMYEDTLVARLMWEQKTLFPENFLFGNQFYVIATPVLAALFYGICGSMNLAMALATTVMSLLILISLAWMIRPFVKQLHIRWAVLLALVSGVFGPMTIVREDGQLFFVMCSFYACYLIAFFFLMGDYARARESEKLRPLAFAIALFLSFCTGMQSLRQTCVSMLPILCFELLAIFMRLIKRQPLMLRSMSLLRAASYLAANIGGMLFISQLGVKRNEIYYGQSIFSGASISAKLKDVQDALLTVTGLDFTQGTNGFFFTLIFLFFSATVIGALIVLIRKKDFASPLAVFWWLCIISVCAVIAASFVTSVSLRPIYLFPCYALPALSVAVLYTKLSPKLQSAACVLLCILAASNLYYSYHVNIELALKDYSWPEKEVADYAVENGFEYIYGSHSHTAPGIAAASDGKLIAGCWEDDVIFKVSPHINIKTIYHLDEYEKALFVFLETEVPLAQHEADASGTTLSFHGQIGEYYMYTSSNQMMYPISENIIWAKFFPEYN